MHGHAHSLVMNMLSQDSTSPKRPPEPRAEDTRKGANSKALCPALMLLILKKKEKKDIAWIQFFEQEI